MRSSPPCADGVICSRKVGLKTLVSQVSGAGQVSNALELLRFSDKLSTLHSSVNCGSLCEQSNAFVDL